MFNPDKHFGMGMDSVQAHDGCLFVVVDPLSMPEANATTDYLTAKSIRTRYTHLGVIIHLSPETIQKISTGEVQELYL